MRRIAIWNTAFLGDAALTLPLVLAVPAGWPDAAAGMYVRRGVGSLAIRSEEHTSALQSHVRISYAVLCFKKLKMPRQYPTL